MIHQPPGASLVFTDKSPPGPVPVVLGLATNRGINGHSPPPSLSRWSAGLATSQQTSVPPRQARRGRNKILGKQLVRKPIPAGAGHGGERQRANVGNDKGASPRLLQSSYKPDASAFRLICTVFWAR